MFEKIVKGIIVTELIGAGLLGAWIYSELRYRQGKHDAYVDVGNQFCEILKEVTEKHESEKEET